MTIAPPFDSVSEFIDLLRNREINYRHDRLSNPPAVSIISPFFNDSEHFAAAYQSVIEQTWQNFEWLIVDDCSTEPESLELFASLEQLSPKIKTLRNSENKGPSASRNRAISQAQGKYLFFMDTDDIIEPTYIEKCVLFLEVNPDFSLVNSYSVGFEAEEYWWSYGFNQPQKFIEQNWVTGRLLYRTADFLELGGYHEKLRIYEDWERWLRAIAKGQKAWTIPEFLDCYRRTHVGLLADGRQKTSENRQIINLIKARYQPFFEANQLGETYIPRPNFEVATLKGKIELENTLQDNNIGKRILCWFPHLVVGGADKFNLDLLTHLKARGYDLTIATTLPSEHTWHAQFYRLTPDIFHLSGFVHDCHWLKLARYLIQSRQIDVVLISNSYYAYYLLPWLRQEFPDVAFIDYTHTDDPGWRGGGYPRVSCQFSDFLDLQIVSSQNLARHYQQLKPETKDKLRVCYTNEEPQKWQPDWLKRQQIREQLAIKPETTVFLFPARMAAQKRPLLLVDIINQLLAQSLPVMAIALGSGELLEPVKAKIEGLNLQSHFHLLPAVSPEDMIGFYSAADILLLPSEYEGLSLAIYEAMSMALPIVAADVGGHRELVIPECGFLLPKGAGDEAEIAEYVKILEPLIKDASLRHQLGSAARQRIIDHFPLTAMVDQMEALFSEAIQLRKQQSQVEFSTAIAEEMLIWLQENVALDFIWQDLQSRNEELASLKNFVQQIQYQNSTLNAQNQAWIQIVRREQVKLNQENRTLQAQNQASIEVAKQAQLELMAAKRKIAQLESQLKQRKFGVSS